MSRDVSDLINILKQSADNLHQRNTKLMECRDALLSRYGGVERQEKEVLLQRLYPVDMSNSFVDQLKKFHGIIYETK